MKLFRAFCALLHQHGVVVQASQRVFVYSLVPVELVELEVRGVDLLLLHVAGQVYAVHRSGVLAFVYALCLGFFYFGVSLHISGQVEDHVREGHHVRETVDFELHVLQPVPVVSFHPCQDEVAVGQAGVLLVEPVSPVFLLFSEVEQLGDAMALMFS